MSNKERGLEKLANQIRKCKKCSLWRARKNGVPGEGPANAEIIVIGQAPGAQENKTGRPFIGRTGQFLDQLLKIAKIEREKVFITSPIKCFPPKNRKPTKKEIAACLPYLKKQIEIIAPRAIYRAKPVINPQKFILLGEVAFSVFFPGKKLKDFRGKWVKKDDRKFFVTYHPAAGIRFQKFKRILEKDFRKLSKK